MSTWQPYQSLTKTLRDMTSPMRKTIKIVPPKGYAKIEFIDESVFKLDNFFSITYFINDIMYDKRYELPRNSISEDHGVDLPVLGKKGILAIQVVTKAFRLIL